MSKKGFQNNWSLEEIQINSGKLGLGQNYPNPFCNFTTIGFSVTEFSLVWLDVYNSVGKKIAQLLKTQLPAGVHTVECSRLVGDRVLPPGNYAYRLNVENSNGLYRLVKVMTIY